MAFNKGTNGFCIGLERDRLCCRHRRISRGFDGQCGFTNIQGSVRQGHCFFILGYFNNIIFVDTGWPRDGCRPGQSLVGRIAGSYLLVIDGRMETETAGSPESQTAQEDPRDSVQKASGSATIELHIHKVEPSAKRVDKLFPNRKHEEMAEGSVGPMAAPQSASSDSQTVEEA